MDARLAKSGCESAGKVPLVRIFQVLGHTVSSVPCGLFYLISVCAYRICGRALDRHDAARRAWGQSRPRLTGQPVAACLLDRRWQRLRQVHDRARLAGKHGVRLYSTDEAMGGHANRWLPEDCPNLAEFVKMSMDQRWSIARRRPCLKPFIGSRARAST